MKTNTFKYLGLALMAVLMVGLTSCEVEIDSFYDDDNNGPGYYNRSADLCSRTWVSFYRDIDNNYCCQELDVYKRQFLLSGYQILPWRNAETGCWMQDMKYACPSSGVHPAATSSKFYETVKKAG